MNERSTAYAAVIPSSTLAGVVELGQRNGAAIERWFSGTGLTADQLVAAHTKVSFRQAAAVLHRALVEMPNGPIGMQVGGRDALLSLVS